MVIRFTIVETKGMTLSRPYELCNVRFSCDWVIPGLCIPDLEALLERRFYC